MREEERKEESEEDELNLEEEERIGRAQGRAQGELKGELKEDEARREDELKDTEDELKDTEDELRRRRSVVTASQCTDKDGDGVRRTAKQRRQDGARQGDEPGGRPQLH